MNRLFYLLPVFAFTLALGCTPTEKKADVPPPPKVPEQQAATPAPAAAPAPPAQQPESAKQIVEGYAQGLVKSVDKGRLAQARVDMEGIQTAVRNYQVDNGRYPASLDEVKGSLRPGVDTGIFNYDPNTGVVSLK